jgi:hypothetical protein
LTSDLALITVDDNTTLLGGIGMAEKVAKLGVKREPGFLYFLRGSDVWKTPMKRAGGPSAAGKAEKVAGGNFTRQEGYLYFLDSSGDVSRAKRAVGGQKRKAKAGSKKAKKAGKKPVKKAAAKKGGGAGKKGGAAKKKGKRK